MKIKKYDFFQNLNEEKNNLNQNPNHQYELDKEKEWEKDRHYVSTFVAEILASEIQLVEQIADSMSDRKVATRLVTKFFERKMECQIHPEFFTKWIKTPDGVYPEGRYLNEFDIDKARDGVHMFGQVRLNRSSDKVLDFVLISKKNDFVKKFAVECQTNLGHLKPMEKHRDCVLAREITLNTDFTFLEYSSREIFWDSNISSLDQLVDELEFVNTSKVSNNRFNFKDSDFPF